MIELIQPILEFLAANPQLVIFYYLIIIGIIMLILIKYAGIPFYRYICKPIYNFFNAVDETIESVKIIKAELQPNGGGSIKDKINKIEKSLSGLDDHIFAINSKRTITLELMGWAEGKIIGCFEADHGGLLTYITDKYAEITGSFNAQVLGNSWINLISDEDREFVVDEWHAAIRDERPFQTEFNFYNRRANKNILVRVLALPFKVKNKLMGYVGGIVQL